MSASLQREEPELPDFDFPPPDALLPGEIVSTGPEPFRDFEFDLHTNRLRVSGYTPAEAAELLELYRSHIMALAEYAQAQHTAAEQ
jgi:hypothetical protein